MKMNSGPVTQLDELEEIAKKNGLVLQEATLPEGEREYMILLGSELEPMIDFAVASDRKVIFYEYTLMSEEDYLIDDDEYDLFCSELSSDAMDLVDEYNKKVSGIDFSCPFALTVFCLYEGHIFGITAADLDMMDIVMLDPDDIIDKAYVLSALSDKGGADDADRRRDLHDELFDIVTSDAEFRQMTNMPSRSEYLDAFLDEPGNEKYADIFKHVRQGPNWSKKQFLTSAWRGCKERQKKK